MRWRQAKKRFKRNLGGEHLSSTGIPTLVCGPLMTMPHRHWCKIERPHLRGTGKTYRMIERVVSAVADGKKVMVVAHDARMAQNLGYQILGRLPHAVRNKYRVEDLLRGDAPVFVVSAQASEGVRFGRRIDVELWDHHAVGQR